MACGGHEAITGIALISHAVSAMRVTALTVLTILDKVVITDGNRSSGVTVDRHYS